MNEQAEFPAPEPTDPEDVVWALQTAQTMWERRDLREAVRWLRRAAESASDAGNDLRALALARAAADLTQAHQLSVTVPPPGHTDSIPPTDDALMGESDMTIPEGIPAAALRSSPRAAPPPLRRPAAQEPTPSSPPPPPSRSAPSASAVPAPAQSSPSVSPPASSPLRSSPSVAPGPNLRPRHTWRVAVEPSGEERGGLWVRALADGEPVPDGMHEALLTALEPGAHVLSKKR